jgi:hypothetical protein
MPMKRARKLTKPRLTRDSEKLVALALGMAGSRSYGEDRFWEEALIGALSQLADAKRDSVIENALDQLDQTHEGGYEELIEMVEAIAERVVIEHQNQTWIVSLIVVPLIATSKYNIPFGAITPEQLAPVNEIIREQILAKAAHVTLFPNLFSIEQLPQKFSVLRDVLRRLGAAAVDGVMPDWTPKIAAEPPQLPADARFIVGAVAARLDQPSFCWQEWDGHRGRAYCQERWEALAPLALAGLMPGCQFESLLPDAYFANARETDRRIRPITLHAAVAFLSSTLKTPANDLRAIITGFGENHIDEFRIGFTQKNSNDVLHGVVWPLFDQEDETLALLEIEACLRANDVTRIEKLSERLEPEYCSDCGAPLFADGNGDVVHPELPEQVEPPSNTLH